MRDLCNQTNTPYLIASAFAIFTLLASAALSAASYFYFLSSVEFLNSTLTVVTVLSILSVLVVVLSYKIISNNKEIEARKNKFAKKELELEKELALKEKAKETANNQVEELNNQLQQKNKEIVDMKQQLNDKYKMISELTTEKEKLEVELRSQKEKIQQLSTVKNKVNLNPKNKELSDKDSEILALKNLLDVCYKKEELSKYNTQVLDAKVRKLTNERNSLVEKHQVMKQELVRKDFHLTNLDYDLNRMRCKEESLLHSTLVKDLREKVQNQIQDSVSKEKLIQQIKDQREQLIKEVNLLNQKNKALYDKMTAYSSKNEELITFISETLSNIEREKKDLESLYSSEKKHRGFLALETIEAFLENFKELYSKTKDRAEKLGILVQRKGELSNPLASLVCRSFIQKH